MLPASREAWVLGTSVKQVWGVELGSGIPQCWEGAMAQNPLAQEGSWFRESWKRRASRVLGGEGGGVTGEPLGFLLLSRHFNSRSTRPPRPQANHVPGLLSQAPGH